MHPPFAQPDPGRRTAHEVHELAPEPTATESSYAPELPSIDEFVDKLPLIDEFLAPPEPVRPVSSTGRPPIDNEGWAVADWQSYDWNQIASLGAPAPEEAEAHAAWSSTDWDPAATRARGQPAHEVAAALDEIARRIRTGELSLAQLQSAPPEAAIAAVVAALLRTKG